MNLISNWPEEIFEIATNFQHKKATLKDLNKIIEQLSSKKDDEDKNKFKGDVFEVFTWAFFKAFKNDPSVGLVEYKPIDPDEDFGVDGAGVNANGDEVVVQVKYRRNPMELVTYGEIAKTYTSGKLMLSMSLKKKNSIYVFTNAIDITSACKTVFGDIIKVLNTDAIDHYVHGNKSFWKFFYKEIYDYLDV